MRKLIYPLSAISTFIFGVSIYLLWFYFVPVRASLCDLARHPDWYDQRIVRVTAPASAFYGGMTISDFSCGSMDSAAVIMLDNSYIPKPEVQALLIESAHQIRKADVVVIGRFDKNATMGCFGPKFGIVATNVELKSAVSVEPLPRRGE